DLATKLPLALICDIMGLPREDWDLMVKWANMIICCDDREFQDGGAGETQFKGFQAIHNYCLEMAKRRREHAEADMFTDLGTARINGNYLRDVEVGQNGSMLVVAGLETTRNAIAVG